MSYAELHCLSCYSFLRAASHPHELVQRAAKLGYTALAITDECSLAGVVKAHVAAKEAGLKLIIGSEFTLQEGITVVALAPCRQAYSELSGLISKARRRSPKGQYRLNLQDLCFHLKRCLLIWRPKANANHNPHYGKQLARYFAGRLWLGVSHHLANSEVKHYLAQYQLAQKYQIPMLACGEVTLHESRRKPLLDVFTALRHGCSVAELGTRRAANAQAHLRPLRTLATLYPLALLKETQNVAARCHFCLSQLRYEYPEEIVPKGFNANSYLKFLVKKGKRQRWPGGVPADIDKRIAKELKLIGEMSYEYYFLTVYDIVQFAKQRGILCQGRGSAANSVVCYCLFITEVSPERIALLFERFISKERNEPPDIDVDFEHERREEVIQYIYQKYSRKRAALAATVITYRSRSAVRDVGKALGIDSTLIEDLSQSMGWWEKRSELLKRFAEHGLDSHTQQARLFYELVQEIHGFPRHLSQHVGGFIITRSPVSTLVPVENAAMAERTVIQWDKEDIEALGLLKVDVLALGMLSAIRKSLDYIRQYQTQINSVGDIPTGCPATYQMLQRADTIGVFQIESRAQMSMLPRLRPASFYDLVIQIAIVRPGPIQGDMVHPYLRRRAGIEAITYPSPAIENVLKRTLGVPIFQEQVIKLAMVAAGFSGGEADQLRRAISNWGKNSRLLEFEEKLVNGMRERGYSTEFAKRLFEQIKGFGGYGFPESHSASFALLAYSSAWLKRHHSAAFYTGLLNSQPMGFYSISQLVQDARKHGVTFLPVDVAHSLWDHQVLVSSRGETPPRQIRLGFRIINGLCQNSALHLIGARNQRPFTDLADLKKRAQLNARDLQALTTSDALLSISGHRQQSQWRLMSLPKPRPLLEKVDATAAQAPQQAIAPASEIRQITADYHSTGLSLRRHPMSLLRGEKAFRNCLRHSDLATLGNHRFISIAGLVTCRQRPGTASGVLFLTLEDETGNSNVVVWSQIQQRFRAELLNATLLRVSGTVESKDNVTHVIARHLQDDSHHLEQLKLASRDFH
ncbi:MAG: error-prone DNA polymerase [Gammaproteobacteria bacterium]|nr:MAG: error-prone DNA polymerase [Gammaproteobacteria bacterium]